MSSSPSYSNRSPSPTTLTSCSAAEDGHPADALVDRCQTLFDELETFQKHLRRTALQSTSKQSSTKQSSAASQTVEIRHFRNAVQVELRSLEALSYSDPTDIIVQRSIRSSNLPFLEEVWKTAKRCKGIEGISKTVYYTDQDEEWNSAVKLKKEKLEAEGSNRSTRTKKKKLATMVDIVVQSGLEWIKVSTVSEQRLAFEAASEGVGHDQLTSEDEDENDGGGGKYEEGESVPRLENDGVKDGDIFPLVRVAKTLVKAASQIRVQYLNPTVTIVLSNIPSPQPSSDDPKAKLVSSFIAKLLDTGVRIQTKTDILTRSEPQPPLEKVLDVLAPSFLTTALATVSHSDTINIDCTVLLALVSDISHMNPSDCPRKPYLHIMVLRQLEAEEIKPVLPGYVYPVCNQKRLVCTKEAAQRFWEIVSIVGSDTEKQRAALILPFTGFSDKVTFVYPSSSTTTTGSEVKTISDLLLENDGISDRRELLQKTSVHEIPETFQLPIEIVQSKEAELMATNSVAEKISSKLSKVNRSALYTGWHEKWATLTSNGTVMKRLKQLVEEAMEAKDGNLEKAKGGEFAGLKTVLLPMSRSLVGTPKKCFIPGER